jgi:inner membrane protein
MDNVCHTLVGAALGQAGLNRTTRFGSSTLMIAANLPDIDVLVFATDLPSVAFRRGWTHGLLAQALLPLLLTLAVTAYSRWGRRGAADPGPPLRPAWVLALSVIGIYSHVFLDYLNNYGIRLLAPVDWRWFYGDAVFIVDPWLWLSLGAGVWLARRHRRPAMAILALALASIYIGGMLVSARAARAQVRDAWRQANGREPSGLMASPRPATPFSRDVIVDAGEYYETGRFAWPGGTVRFSGATVPKNDAAPAVRAARDAPHVRGFLVWSRFPFWTVEPTPGGQRVTVRDMRFGNRFEASTIVPVAGHRTVVASPAGP